MLVFHTRSGNQYAYSTQLNAVLPILNNTIKELLEEIDYLGLSSEKIAYLTKKYEAIISAKPILTLCNINMNKLRNNNELNASNIRTNLDRNGFYELSLEVTQACNLKCKYCIFSEHYELYRDPTSNHMTWTTAKAAIDWYFYYLEIGKIKNLNRKAVVGFYGGEPLINFNLIKKCVEYINENYSEYEIYYTITTNGTLLSDENIAFIKKNNIGLCISIDGDQENHDRNRIYPDSSGSHAIIMDNIKKIGPFQDNIMSHVTYDFKTNLLNVHNFFANNDVPLCVSIGEVSALPFSNYYAQCSKEDIDNYTRMLTQVKKEWYTNILLNMGECKIGVIEMMMLHNIFKINCLVNNIEVAPRPLLPYSGACIPGTKIFVDYEGKYNICEKINGNFDIGNIFDGLDFDKIALLMDQFKQRVLLHCDTCPIKNCCTLCFCHFAGAGEFIYDKRTCDHQIQNTIECLEDAYSTAEMIPDIINKTNKLFLEIGTGGGCE